MAFGESIAPANAIMSGRARAVRSNADAACVTITELADSLVREEDLSFRLRRTTAASELAAAFANLAGEH